MFKQKISTAFQCETITFIEKYNIVQKMAHLSYESYDMYSVT